jgi:hypothetical protein
MIGMGRGELLSAVALVVASRQEPSQALRDLAEHDPALRRLSPVATAVGLGWSLPAALRDAGLINAATASHLAGLPPERTAAHLRRLASEDTGRPSPGLLARWFPVWAVLAAVLPSLLLMSVVCLMSGADFPGLYVLFTGRPPRGGMTEHLLMQAWLLLPILMACVAAVWWGLGRMPWVHLITAIDPASERARLTAVLIEDARSGRHDWETTARRWRWLTGTPGRIRQHLQLCGHDLGLALASLGHVPPDRDGRRDWQAADDEARGALHRAQAAGNAWLSAILIAMAITGFFVLSTHPLGLGIGRILFHISWRITRSHGWIDWFPVQFAIMALSAALVAVMAAWLVQVGRWCFVQLRGPGPDWPVVADRLARALDRREPLPSVVAGLTMQVGWPMRRRLDRLATVLHSEPHLGRALLAARVAPRGMAASLATATSQDLPAALIVAGPLRSAGSQVLAVWLPTAAVVAGVIVYIQTRVQPHFLSMLLKTHVHADTAGIATANLLALVTLLVAVPVILLVLVLIDRLGLRHIGWRRRWRGLLLRESLARKDGERAIAARLASTWRRPPARLLAAGEAGDLAAIARCCGWRARTAADLDRALNTDTIRRERRRSLRAVLAQLVLPLLTAGPVGLAAASVMLSMGAMLRGQIDTAHPHGLASGGGWMTWIMHAELDAHERRLELLRTATPVEAPP